MQRGLLDPAWLQQLLFQALDQSDNFVLVLEQLDGQLDRLIIAASNDAFCRASGFSFDELIGRPLLELAAADANPQTCAALTAAACERKSFRSELLCSRKSGQPFWLGLHLMPVSASVPPCYVLLGRDITATLRDRQQHEAIQGLLAKVFVMIHAAVAITDDHGVVLMVNPALDRLLGVRAGDLIGRDGAACIAPEARPAAVAARQRQMAAGHDYAIETTLQRADGSRVQVDLAATLVQREDLKRFRVLTVTPRRSDATTPAVSVHVAGKIRLIGLDEVRAALGAGWPSVAARVMTSAEHIIRRRCGPRDTWSRLPDGGFLICFGEASEDEAAFRAATIAREIRIRLIGEGENPAITHVSGIAAAVDVPDQPGRSPDALAAAISERLNARLGQIEGQARETLRAAVSTARCELAAVRNRRLNEIVGQLATLPRELEHAIQCALAALPPRECQAFDFDRLVLGAAAEQVVAGLASGSEQWVMVEVNFEVFLDRHCTERYITACQQLDERLRPRLMLVLSGVPHGVPRSRVLECVTRLRPFCHAVGFHAESVELPPVEPSALGASIVVVREADLNGFASEPVAKLDRLLNTIRTHRARVMAREVSNWENARRLLKLGVDLVALAEG